MPVSEMLVALQEDAKELILLCRSESVSVEMLEELVEDFNRLKESLAEFILWVDAHTS